MTPTQDYSTGWLLRASRAALSRATRDRADLRPYQAETLIPFVSGLKKCAAYVDMGLGKTVSMLTVIDDLLSRGKIDKVLIVAPKRVAIQTWPTEIASWRHTAWMTYSLIRPDEKAPEVTSVMRFARQNDPLSPNHAAGKARTAEFDVQKCVKAMAPQPIHIINREAVQWLVDFHCKNPNGKYDPRRWPYDMIVIDESTSFADHKTKRWKAMNLVAQHTKRVVLLSGTPAPEGILDLFAQIYLLDGGKRFGRGITVFKERYLEINPYSRKIKPRPGAVEEVTRLCGDICLVMKESDYLDVREPLVVQRPIVLDEDMIERYNEFEKTMLLEIGGGAVIEAVNAGVLCGKLLQFASGNVYRADRNVETIHDFKIQELQEMLPSIDGPVLVAYWFKPSLAALRKAFPKATVMDREGKCVHDWNAGKIPMLFVHPQSAGHGLNMQTGPGHTLVFYDTPQSNELYWQVRKRIDRSGQRNLVKIFHLVTQDTIEMDIVPSLIRKELMQESIRRLLQKRRERVLEEV